MNNKKLDKTSIIMITVFAVIVIGSLVAFVLATVLGGGQVKNNAGQLQETLQQEETAVEEESDESAEEPQQTIVVYENYMELADRFIEICKAGDVEAMYGLYYRNLLDDRYKKVGVSKQEFDEVMKDNMLHMVDFEEFVYGGEDLLATNSPAGYVNELYYRAYGESFPYTDVVIDDCVDLRAYFENGAFIDFMLAKVDGLWYAVT